MQCFEREIRSKTRLRRELIWIVVSEMTLGDDYSYRELIGVALIETFLTSVEKNGKQLLDFIGTVCADKSKQVLQAVTKLKILRGQLIRCSEDIINVVLLLLAYFDEKEEILFHYVDETCSRQVQVETLPVTPCIVIHCLAKIKVAPWI